MTVERARLLRRDATRAERLLWSRLRQRQVGGARFRRQVPIGPYVADFCCFDARLVIELDGGQHASQQSCDGTRTQWLNGQGFTVLRYWNEDVFKNLDDVLSEIYAACTQRVGLSEAGDDTRPGPSPKGIGKSTGIAINDPSLSRY